MPRPGKSKPIARKAIVRRRPRKPMKPISEVEIRVGDQIWFNDPEKSSIGTKTSSIMHVYDNRDINDLPGYFKSLQKHGIKFVTVYRGGRRTRFRL